MKAERPPTNERPAQPTLQPLLLHLLTTPGLPNQLRTLHDLALYDSGDALLGEDEKLALLNTRQLADLLERVDAEELRRQLQ